MPINNYRVLQSVLTQTCDVICKVYGLSRKEAFDRAEAFIKQNSEQWRLPDPIIQYGDPFCRMAYLYMNVAIHSSLVERAIRSFPEVGKTIHDKRAAGDELRVCALGGGPGSELLGLVRVIQSQKNIDKAAYLDFLLVDRIKEWDESWHALKQGVEDQIRIECGADRSKWPTIISRSFLPLDVTNVTDFENFATRFNGTDIFLFCYLVSELKVFVPSFEKVVNLLVTRSSSNALMVFIDRNERAVRTTIEQLVHNNASLSLIGTKQERGRVEDDPVDLGEWYIHLPSLPRQKWLAYFAVAKKKT